MPRHNEQGTTRQQVRIVGTGRFLPGEPRDNAWVLDVCTLPSSVTKEWIESRIRINTRHCARQVPMVEDARPVDGWHNSDMAANAVRAALEMCGKKPQDLDLLIVATCTPDVPVPSVATFVQDKLGIPEMAAMDIRSACSGTTQALIAAVNMLENGYYKTAAIVGSDLGSVFGDCIMAEDAPKMECVNVVMMGDGAGAMILEAFPCPKNDAESDALPGMEIVFTAFNSIGAGKGPGMWLPAGGSSNPCTQGTIDRELHRFKHDFREVLAHGPELYFRALEETLSQMNLTYDDIDVIVPHQANGQLLDIAVKLGVPQDRVYFNFNRVGNTANASLMLCMDELARGDTSDGSEQTFHVRDGGNILLLAAESTKWLYGAILIKYKPLVASNKASNGAVVPLARRSFMDRLYGKLVLGAINTIFVLRKWLA